MTADTTKSEAKREEYAGRLSDFAYEALRDQLVRGAFRPGTKLPIRTVAEAHSVGSTPAREAINRLVVEGALVMAGPKTVIVPFLTLEALYEITQMRLALEGRNPMLAGELAED